MSILKSFVAIIFFYLTHLVADGSYFLPENFWFIEENSGAGNIASANAVLAGFTPGEGFLINPATINMAIQYSVSGQKSFDDSSYQANIQDSKTSALGGALSLKRLSPIYDFATLEDTIKLALNFGGGKLFVGVMGKRNLVRGESDPHYNLDGGLLIDFNSYVKMGATFQNILATNYSFYRGRILALGAGLTLFQTLEIYGAYKKVVQTPYTVWEKWEAQVSNATAVWMLAQNKNTTDSFHLATRYTIEGATLSAGAIMLLNKSNFWTLGARYQYGNLALQYAVFGLISAINTGTTTTLSTGPVHELSLMFTL